MAEDDTKVLRVGSSESSDRADDSYGPSMSRRDFFGFAKLLGGMALVGGVGGVLASIGRHNYFIDATITEDPVYTPHSRGSFLQGDKSSEFSFAVMTGHGPKSVNVNYDQEAYSAMLKKGDKVRIWYKNTYKSWFRENVEKPVLNLYKTHTSLEKITAQAASAQTRS